jgi:hypothetical protein
MHRPCATCPFRRQFRVTGALDWVNEIVALSRNGQGLIAHSCHKTDPKACFSEKGSNEAGIRQCIGLLAILKKQNPDDGYLRNPNSWEEILSGQIKWGDIDTSKVFDTIEECMAEHAWRISRGIK